MFVLWSFFLANGLYAAMSLDKISAQRVQEQFPVRLNPNRHSSNILHNARKLSPSPIKASATKQSAAVKQHKLKFKMNNNRHIIYNPASGKGKAKELLHLLQTELAEAGWPENAFQIHSSKGSGKDSTFAYDLAASTPDNSQLTIILISGDGLIHDVINGVGKYNQENVKKVLLVLGIIPGGSGNSLATSLGLNDPQKAIRNIIDQLHNSKPISIAEISVAPTPESSDLNSKISWPVVISHRAFCVISWALHAAIVKYSEYFRFLGPIRFYYVAIWNIAFLKKYRGHLWTSVDHSNNRHSLVSNDELKYHGIVDFTYFLGTKVSFLEDGFCVAPKADPSSNLIDLIMSYDIKGSELSALLGKGYIKNNLPGETILDDKNVHNIAVQKFIFAPVVESKGWLNWLWQRGLQFCGADICIDGEMCRVPPGSAIWVKVTDTRDSFVRVIRQD